jgi:hypothetical protein
MLIAASGRAAWRIFTIQFLILLGLIALYRLYVPRHARQIAAHAAADREKRVTALFQDSVVDDMAREVSVPLDGMMVKRHPQRLRVTFSVLAVEATLGIPDSAMTDFRGGQHLVWIGVAHKLEAGFDTGQLYFLALEDRATGHGVRVYKASDSWQPY